MRLQICHLSDIHFLEKDNAIEEKRVNLCNAILEDSYKNDKILF